MRTRGTTRGGAAAQTKRRPLRTLLLLTALLISAGILWNMGISELEAGNARRDTSTSGASAEQSTYATPAVVPAEAGRPLVCIDPGHGGSDRGCSYGGVDEADQNLTLALALREELLRRGMGVVMTRETDTYVGLADRADLANAAGADYYISLHRNAVEGGGAQGIEVWHSHGAGEHTLFFADCVEQALIGAGVTKSRGCRGGSEADPNQDYAVCRLTRMSAVLVEMGFLTDAEDNRLFEQNRTAYASALADAVEQAWAQKQGG